MRNRTTIAALTVGLTLGFAAHAAEQVSQPKNDTAHQAPGIVVARDAATGELRAPTAAEMQVLKSKQMQTRVGNGMKAPRTEAEAMKTQRTLKNGGVAMKVSQDRMSSMVASVQPDGSIKISHADENGSAPAAAQEETK